MKRTSWSFPLAMYTVVLMIPPGADAVDINRVSPSHSGTQPTQQPQQNQPVPVVPGALPGQELFHNLGNHNDPFFTPDLFSPVRYQPGQQPQPSPGTQTTPDSQHEREFRSRPGRTRNDERQPVTSSQRKWRLGVMSRDLETGVRIESVTPGSAAERAGLEARDLIVAVNGYQVGFVNGHLFDCATEFERHADRDGWVTMLVQNHRNNQLLNVPVQLDSTMARIQGSVALPNRQSLPEGAVLHVELKEILRSGANPITLASQEIKQASGHPIPFEIAYDPASLSRRGQHVIVASVVQNGRETFRTTEHQRAIEQGQPRRVTVQLEPVRPQYGERPVPIDRESQIAQIVRWFQQYLGRDPSDNELAVWMSAIRSGYPLSQVQQELLAHNVFFNRNDRNDRTYVARVHELLVGREPNEFELRYWLDRYHALGGIRRDFAKEFQEAVGIH